MRRDRRPDERQRTNTRQAQRKKNTTRAGYRGSKDGLLWNHIRFNKVPIVQFTGALVQYNCTASIILLAASCFIPFNLLMLSVSISINLLAVYAAPGSTTRSHHIQWANS